MHRLHAILEKLNVTRTLDSAASIRQRRQAAAARAFGCPGGSAGIDEQGSFIGGACRGRCASLHVRLPEIRGEDAAQEWLVLCAGLRPLHHLQLTAAGVRAPSPSAAVFTK